MSATERSRRFREAHPTYHAEWKRRERAHTDGLVAAMRAPVEAVVKEPLMLPAPQVPIDDLFAQLAALRERQAELELVLASAT